MKNATGGSGSGLTRIAWIAAVIVIWPLWYLLYALTFAWVNESLTRIAALSAENGMLPPVMEFTLQVVLAAAFGFLGMFLFRLARGPKIVWYVAAGMSVLLSLGTVGLWMMSAAAEGAESNPFWIYAVVGAAMALGCWVGSSVVRVKAVRGKTRSTQPSENAPATSEDSAA